MSDIHTLDQVQQVLRGLVVSLIGTQQLDATKLSTHLQAFASAPDLDPSAQKMLLDLAEGAAMLGKAQAAGRPS
ncbi:hypothetical protein [Microvirgula aerodenitrificans]|uniref:hypothetical protein n=1 Tax=Microvirgula aerodenitrificans TaxID=57480 RepID=UPI0028EEDA56|nr:hypothetical protein [Microvirgula aerodenitrificans]